MIAHAMENVLSSVQVEDPLQKSFANGTYPEWIAKEMFREGLSPHILNDIAQELEAMKLLDPEQRLSDYNWIVRY